MAIRPDGSSDLVLTGDFQINAEALGGPPIKDSFNLTIRVPKDYPLNIPRVFENSNRIPRQNDHHVNGSGSLCLGSPLRLISHLGADHTLSGFTQFCLVPFLYAFARREAEGGSLAFGELAHEIPGLIEDYKELLGLKCPMKVVEALEYALKKKRIANKLPCPCGCGLRLGKCPLHLKVNHIRKHVPKSWLRKHLGH